MAPPKSAASRATNYGVGVVEIDPGHVGEVDVTDQGAVVERLLAVFRAPGYKAPLLPRVGIELIALTRKQDVTVPQIVALLEQDALIAAGVLKLAQSAFYARGASIMSLHNAIIRLGLHTISDLFLETAASMTVFRAPGFQDPMNRLRRHSTAVAHVARITARHTSVFDEYAFLCGLMHDAGIAASIIALAQKPPRRPRRASLAPAPSFDVLWPSIRDAHERAAEVLGTLWRLPLDVTRVIANHHQPQIAGVTHPLCAVITVAETIASELGFAFEDETPTNAQAACEAIGLTAPMWRAIIAEAKEVLAQIK